MFLILFITQILALQLKLIPLEYKKGSLQDQAYIAKIIINNEEQNMVVDNISKYTWIYSKNPITNEPCIGCPSSIKQFDCKSDENCKKIENQQPITLSNQNECILMNEKIIIDSQQIKEYQICLTYKVNNKQYEKNGLLSLVPQSEKSNSNLLNQLETLKKDKLFQITTTPGQERLFLGEQSNYLIKKTVVYQNQADDQWKLQYQLYQKEEEIINKQDNKFISFDITTKYNTFTPEVIKKLIKQIKSYDGLFCQVENNRLECLCSKAQFVDKIPTIKIGFNGLPKKYELDLNPQFVKEDQKCYLNVLQDQSQSILGNNFFQFNGAIFDAEKKEILIGETYQSTEDQMNFENSYQYCLFALALILFGLITLLIFLKQIQKEDFQKPKYVQPTEKPLYVISKSQQQFQFRPQNLEISRNQQLVYSRR